MREEIKEKELLNALIMDYRKVIQDRYNFENLKNRPDFPDSFNEDRVNLFKNYFLDYIYPLPSRREELDEAFHHLDNYIHHPEKLFRILIESANLLFKYGRHLPKLFRAGIHAMRSYRKATSFEKGLVKNAMMMDLKPPFDKPKIDTLIRALPREEIDEFIESGFNLFETLHDRELVGKIKEVIGFLIMKMKKRPNVYSRAEIRGLEIGDDMISKGDLLFDQLSKEHQRLILAFTHKIEREVVDQIYSKE